MWFLCVRLSPRGLLVVESVRSLFLGTRRVCSVALSESLCAALGLQFREDRGHLPEPGDMEQAEAVYAAAKAINDEGAFKAEGLEENKASSRARVGSNCARGCSGGFHSGTGGLWALGYIMALSLLEGPFAPGLGEFSVRG